MQHLYEVRRRLPADRVYEAGEIVDGTNWPPGRAEQLVAQRYLVRLLDPALASQEPALPTARARRERDAREAHAAHVGTSPQHPGPVGPEGEPDATQPAHA